MAESIISFDEHSIIYTKYMNGPDGWFFERKYGDGTMVITGRFVLSRSAYASVYNGFYPYRVDVDWASNGLDSFANTSFTILHSWHIGSGYSIADTCQPLTKGSARLVGLGSSSGTQTCTISFEATGRWK